MRERGETAQDELAVGNSVPFYWQGDYAGLPDRGWDEILERGFRDRGVYVEPNVWVLHRLE